MENKASDILPVLGDWNQPEVRRSYLFRTLRKEAHDMYKNGEIPEATYFSLLQENVNIERSGVPISDRLFREYHGRQFLAPLAKVGLVIYHANGSTVTGKLLGNEFMINAEKYKECV